MSLLGLAMALGKRRIAVICGPALLAPGRSKSTMGMDSAARRCLPLAEANARWVWMARPGARSRRLGATSRWLSTARPGARSRRSAAAVRPRNRGRRASCPPRPAMRRATPQDALIAADRGRVAQGEADGVVLLAACNEPTPRTCAPRRATHHRLACRRAAHDALRPARVHTDVHPSRRRHRPVGRHDHLHAVDVDVEVLCFQPRNEPPHATAQISTCAPSSTRRLPGIWKKADAGAALRCMSANSLSRQIGMPRCADATTVSRLAK